MKRSACSGLGFVLFLVLAGVGTSAQNQAPTTSQKSSSGSSLGDYARQIRKDPSAKALPKVFDNDNLPKDDKLSVIGQTPAPASGNSSETKAAQSDSASPAAGEANAGTANKGATDAKAATEAKTGSTGSEEKAPLTSTVKASGEEATKPAAAKQWSDKLTAQKEQIDLLARELDVLQREYQIRAAAMYADAGNRMRNSSDWDKQDAQYKQQIADKQKALDDAKQKLDDIQEDARKAGAPVREP
jgi:hypothetical protein